MSKTVPITVAHGDGIGPEIMTATLDVLKALAMLWTSKLSTSAKRFIWPGILRYRTEFLGSLRRTKVFLKHRSLLLRRRLQESQRHRPENARAVCQRTSCVSYHPLSRQNIHMDVVSAAKREDLYAGIEHRQTTQVCSVSNSFPGPARKRLFVTLFEYARRNNRKKVTCFTKTTS